MKFPILKVAVIVFAILLGGCAGTNFVRVTDDTLVPGQTSYEQIKTRLGVPYREGITIKNEKQMTTASYAYASAGGSPVTEGVTPARSQGFYFWEKTLVGYEFTSSWKEDSTDFDSSKVTQIQKGVSTRNDVVRLLGAPGGKYIYPMIPSNEEEAISYLFSQVAGSVFNLKVYRKQLIVTYNRQGIVTNVEYTESGQK